MLHVSRKTLFLCCLSLLVAAMAGFIAPGALFADEEEDLPKAEAIIDKFIEATGGQAAYDKIKNRVVESVLELKAQGIKINVKMWMEKPNKMYSILESDMMGKSESGCDGEVIWENSMMTGPVVKEGKELHDALILRTFDRMIYWKNAYSKAECVAVEDVDGKKCYKVLLQLKEYRPAGEEDAAKKDNPHAAYFNKETYILERLDIEVTSPTGAFPLQSFFKDYKKVDDILVAHELTMKVMGQERTLTTMRVEQNAEIPKDRFKLPDEIQMLVDKKKAEEAEKKG
ncbi:MAG: DUF620 domain-containing protein [Planctomycetota bacterium]|jgi:hypothetical protein